MRVDSGIYERLKIRQNSILKNLISWKN